MSGGTDIQHKPTSGLCTEHGTKCPAGARVSQLIWSWSGMPSGAQAWDLPAAAATGRPDGRVAGQR